MPEEKLKCNCEDDKNHIQYVDKNGDTVVECKECGRFLKFTKPQPGIKEIKG
jgi:ribosomal protein S27E